MTMMETAVFRTPLGNMRLVMRDGAVTGLCFTDEAENGEINEGVRQVLEYFASERRDFDLPLEPEGTPFQKKVWRALMDIPYGETRTYGEIARAIGSPGAARAVGGANNKNPIAVIIPCHRVVGSGGALTGYAGGIDKKQKLLELERG